MAKKIISAKLKNQSVVLRRYEKSRGLELQDEQKMLNICRAKIPRCTSVPEVIGYEGQGAKYYFAGLSKCVEEDFKFSGRNKRPPKDEFNSMLSLGYSILMNEVYSKIEMKGLNPYFGFIHRDAEKHPTLASDVEKKNGISTIHKISDYISKTALLNDLDVRASDILQSNGIIWVEGPSDRVYIKHWLEILGSGDIEEGRDYQFLYYGGRLLSHYTTEKGECGCKEEN